MFNIQPHRIKPGLFLVLPFLFFPNPTVLLAQENISESDRSETEEQSDTNESTVIYGEDFIAQQKGVVNAIDLISLIPGGSAFIPNGNNNSQRGFSNNSDPILINGHRISGKSNSSRQALAQIPVDKILRIEIIRGSSPDIKVAAQGALLNVVLRDDAGGSGTWTVIGYRVGGALGGYAEGSYSSKYKFIDYSVSVSGEHFANAFPRFETHYNPDGEVVFDRNERPRRTVRNRKLSSNATLNFNNDTALNINGQVRFNDFRINRPGTYQTLDESDVFGKAGANIYNYYTSANSWEIGTDYDYPLGEYWQLKVLALHSQEGSDEDYGEDFEILNNIQLNDYRGLSDAFTSENIGRAALVWTPNETHRLEFGTELSFNKRRTNFSFFNLVDGVLVPEDIDSSDVTVKEVRDESFLIHSWKLAEKLNLDQSLTFEYSELEQSGSHSNKRSFQFLKPSWDLRYDITNQDQLQVNARRIISQLDFGDFASSFSGDNQVVGGNKDLAPERSWKYTLTYEHRLPDDVGSLKPSIGYQSFSSKLGPIEVAPGISGVGDVGAAHVLNIKLEWALRLKALNMPNVQFSGWIGKWYSRMTDPFTGERVTFNHWGSSIDGAMQLRYDIPKYGLYFQVETTLNPTIEYRDIDEIYREHKTVTQWVNVFAEKQIGNGLVLRLSYENIFNPKYSRHRYYYDNGIASGQYDRLEYRYAQYNRQFFIFLKGTF